MESGYYKHVTETIRKKEMNLRHKTFILIGIIGILIGITGMANAAPASDTITATATIQTATITLTPVDDLNFGTIIHAGPATILVEATAATDNGPQVDSGDAIITTGTGQRGQFDVSSPVDATVDVSYAIDDGAGNSDQIVSGVNTMVLTAASIGANSTGGTNPTTLALTASQTTPIYVGGLLQVGAGQAEGTYTGTITVTVDYP